MSPAEKDSAHRRTLLRGAGGSFLVRAAGAGLLFGSQIAISRMLGKAGFGTYVYALAWVNMLTAVCLFGLDVSALRFIPRYVSAGAWGLVRGFLAFSGLLQGLMSVSVALVLCGVVLLAWASGGWSGALTVTALVGCGLLPLLVQARMQGAILQAFKRVVLSQWPEQILRPIILVACLFALYLVNRSAVGAPWAMTFNVVATVAALGLLTLFRRRTVPREFLAAPRESVAGQWTRVSWAFFVLAGCEIGRLQIGVVLVGDFVSKGDAGVYAAANALVRVVSLGLIALNTIAAPMISQFYAERRFPQLQKTLTLCAWGGLGYCVLSGGVLLVCGHWILGLFGPEFGAGSACLIILTAGRVVDSVAGLVGYTMLMTDHHVAATRIQLASLVVHVGLTAALIGPFGIEGAAAAGAISMALLNGISVVYVYRKLRINTSAIPVRPSRPGSGR